MTQVVKQPVPVTPEAPRRENPTVFRFKRDWQLHLLMVIPVVWLLVFLYKPMYGAQIAFRYYTLGGGIWNSEWVGLRWFLRFLEMPQFWDIVGNTFFLSLYSMCINFPLPILMALLLNVVRNQFFKKTVQTVSYIPHFISIVVMVAILNQVISPLTGLYGYFYRLFGGVGVPRDIRGIPEVFPHLYVYSAAWQNVGWNTIIYLAALSSVSNELHEAAEIDGATRWKRMFHVDLPAILPTVAIMLIMRVGALLSIGFEKTFLMQNSLNLKKSEVISTYVYKKGLGGTSADQAYGTAVGLLNNAINCALLLLANWISRKASQDEVSLI